MPEFILVDNYKEWEVRKCSVLSPLGVRAQHEADIKKHQSLEAAARRAKRPGPKPLNRPRPWVVLRCGGSSPVTEWLTDKGFSGLDIDLMGKLMDEEGCSSAIYKAAKATKAYKEEDAHALALILHFRPWLSAEDRPISCV